MAETWVINEVPIIDLVLATTINFISNNENFNAFNIARLPRYQILQYGGTLEAYRSDSGWTNQAYRTITFDTSPTGDLLTWLQANAVKQEPPAPTEVKNIKLGSSNVDIKMGEIQVVKVYTGNVLVWEYVEPIPQLPAPTNLTADGTTIEFDEVENAESYEVFADGESIGECTPQPEPTGETWLINEVISDFNADTAINFISNNSSFDTFGGSIHGQYDIKLAYYYQGSGTLVYGDGWVDQAYRTVTFDEPPTGDLRTWLEENAVKQ